MKIAFTFRHMESSEALKGYATDKLSKLQRYLHAPLDMEVTFAVENRLHTIDVHLVSGSENHRGSETSEDMYASTDLGVYKRRAQLNSSKGGQRSQRRRGTLPDPVAVDAEVAEVGAD